MQISFTKKLWNWVFCFPGFFYSVQFLSKPIFIEKFSWYAYNYQNDMIPGSNETILLIFFIFIKFFFIKKQHLNPCCQFGAIRICRVLHIRYTLIAFLATLEQLHRVQKSQRTIVIHFR